MKFGRVAAVALLTAAVVRAGDWDSAVAAYKKGDYQAALREFQELVAANPNHSGSFFMLGATLEKLRRDAEALQAYQKANQLEPANAQYAMAYAQGLLKKGDASAAAKVLSMVSTDNLKPQQKAAVIAALAKARLEANDLNGALEAAKQATQANPSSADSFLLLGTVLSRLNRDGEAFNAYKRAFEISGDPAHSLAAARAGLRAGRLARGGEADAYYAQAAAVASRGFEKRSDAELALLAAEASLGANKFDDALAWLEKTGKDNALTTYYRARCWQGKNDLPKAEGLLRQALQKQPDPNLRRLIYAALGFVLDKQQKYMEAAQAYQEAGDTAKVAEMKDKQAKWEQNQRAAEEEKKYQELKRLQEEYEKLQKGGVPTPTPKK